MKRTITRLTSSLMAHLDEWLTDSEIETHITVIRQAMLDSMVLHLGNQTERPHTWNKILFSTSIETLWYLRTDLMACLSAQCGETIARIEVDAITEKFRSILPPNQMPKLGPNRN